MKAQSLQQEILLITTSRVSQRRLVDVHSFDPSKYTAFAAKHEKARLNGLLEKLLEGAIKKPGSGKKLHLWQIRSGTRFLHFELCTFPVVIEKEYSINPYVFLATTCAN